jgi:hypothetical protein
MARILVTVFLTLAALAATAQQPQLEYATLQVPNEATGYVTAALKAGPENNAGFFVVVDDILRLGNVNYKLEPEPGQGDNPNVFSLRDPNGRYIVCCDQGSLTKSATPSQNTQWFRLRFYNPVQRDEIENRRRATRPSSN